MPRMLGDAFVVISPDTTGFRASTDRQVKQALAGLRYTVPVGVDVEGTMAAIRTLQQRIRQQGLADFLDINIPTGRMITQIQVIRRLLNQAHVSDLLEVNLDKASLSKALAQIKGMSETIPVSFDMQKLNLSKLPEQTVPVNFDISNLPKLGPMQGLNEKVGVTWDIPLLKPLADAAAAGVSESVPVTFDVGKLPVMGALSSISEKVTIDTSGAVQSLAQLAAAASAGNDRLAILNGAAMATGLDAVTMARSLAGANNALEIMGGDAARAAASIAAGRAAIAGLASTGQGADTVMQEMAARMAIMDGSAMNFAAATVAMTSGGGGSGGGLLGLAAALRGASAAFGTANLVTAGWGGGLAATVPILGLVVRSVGLWHVALDAAVEGIIAVTLAAIAITPALLVMANVGQDIYTHFQAVHTVTESLGQSIGPLTGGFDKLAHAMAPQVIEAFGGAMNAVTGKTGLFNEAVTKVVPLIDTWIAKIDLWMNAQSNMGKFLMSGIGFLTQFASIIGNVVSAFGNLLTKDPGIAKFLLDAVNGVALLLKAFSSLPGPVVAAVLALHGIYVWGSVIVPILLRVTGALIGMAAEFLILAANPFTWLAIAAAGLALLAYQSTQATASAKAFIAAINTGLSSDTATQAIVGIAAAIGKLSVQITATSGPVNAMKQWNAQSESLGGGFQRLSFNLRATGDAFARAFGDIPQMLSSWPALGRTAADFGHAIADVFSSSSGASIAAQANIKAFDAEINSLIAQQGTLFRVAGTLVGQGKSLAEAFALEDLAGVKAGDSFQLASQKVKNLITGYQDMSVQGGILLNSVNAITFASLQQQSGIANLNSGWTTFITTVTGGQAAFSTFQQQIGTISSQLSGIAPAAIKGATSLGGLSAASLQASASFTTGVTDANSLINALTLQASASGLASKGTDMLTAATKDTVAQLIPMAGTSAAAQAALIALAQQGGAPAGISFKGLSQWVGTASGSMASAGKSGGPAAQLNSIMGTLATTSDNLTTDVKNLSIALGTDLTKAESDAILLARGGVKPFDDFANAIATTGVFSTATKNAAITLGDEFLTLANNNVPAAMKQFEAFAIGGLGLTKTEADALWQDVLNNGIPALNQTGSAADTLRAGHLAPLGAGVDTVKGKAQSMASYFTGGLVGSMSTVASNLDSLKNNHLDPFNAQMLVIQNTIAGLGNAVLKLPSGKTISVKVDANGYVNVNGFAISAGAFFSPHAEGGFISGGKPGRDSVPAMLMPGEVVVPTKMVRQGAVDHLRGRLPGFAAGGAVGLPVPGPGMVGTSGNLGIAFPQNADNVITNVAVAATDRIAVNATKAFAAYVAQQMNALAGNGPAIVRYARSFLGKIPYVFGGNSMSSGIDCSGFTQQVYGKFGISAPRTSEAQFGWATKSGPVPGGLAFYVSPGGGPPPGHVAIVQDASSVISQGGGMGPKIESLNFLPLMGTGVPKGGLPAAAGGPGNPAISGGLQSIAQALLQQHGWGNQWASFNALENREAGWSLTARNPSSGAYGLAQFINGPSEYYQYGGNPNTGQGQLTAMMNYIAQRYGSANAAWNHESLFGWYGKGGQVKSFDQGGLWPTGTLGWNGSGHTETVTPGPRPAGDAGSAGLEAKLDKVVCRLDAHIALTRKLIDTTASVPAGVGRHVGGAVSEAAQAASFRSRYHGGGA